MENSEGIVKDAEYWATVEVLRARMADMDVDEKWLTHEAVFSHVREKCGIMLPSDE